VAGAIAQVEEGGVGALISLALLTGAVALGEGLEKVPSGIRVNELAAGSSERAGAGRVLNRHSASASEIPLPHPERSRQWLRVALIECARCHQAAERRSPAQRWCPGCSEAYEKERARLGMRRVRLRRRRT